MAQYISRRDRGWKLLQELDKEIVLSEGHRADLLLDLAGLDKNERTMIMASIGNARDFNKIAEALARQHPRIHVREQRLGPMGSGKGDKRQKKGKGRGKGKGKKGKGSKGKGKKGDKGKGKRAALRKQGRRPSQILAEEHCMLNSPPAVCGRPGYLHCHERGRTDWKNLAFEGTF